MSCFWLDCTVRPTLGRSQEASPIGLNWFIMLMVSTSIGGLACLESSLPASPSSADNLQPVALCSLIYPCCGRCRCSAQTAAALSARYDTRSCLKKEPCAEVHESAQVLTASLTCSHDVKAHLKEYSDYRTITSKTNCIQSVTSMDFYA